MNGFQFLGAAVGSPAQLDSGAGLDPVEVGDRSDIIEYREKRTPRQNWLQLLTSNLLNFINLMSRSLNLSMTIYIELYLIPTAYNSDDDDEDDDKTKRKSGNGGGWPLFVPIELPTGR